jgi:hypothetical protein
MLSATWVVKELNRQNFIPGVMLGKCYKIRSNLNEIIIIIIIMNTMTIKTVSLSSPQKKSSLLHSTQRTLMVTE